MSTSPTQPTSNIDKLLIEFSPPIDSSLIYAISSDYPEGQEGFKSAREILLPLAQEIQLEEDLIEETNIGLDLNEGEVGEIDKALDAWDIEQTQIDLASSKAGFESDETTTLADGSDDNITSDEDQDPMISSPSANSPLSLLKCMFPSLGIDVLQRALGSDPSSVNLSVAVDTLLQTDAIPFETSASESSSDPIRSPTKHAPQKRKNQQAKRGQQTYHLTDVMRGDERERLHEAQRKAEEDGPNAIPENKWVVLASQTDFLADLLKIDPSKIKTGYIRHSCNLVLALEEILNKLVNERGLKNLSEEEVMRFTSNLDQMKQLLPDRDEFLLNRLLTVTSNDPDSAFDLVRFLDELFASEGTAMWNFFHRVPINDRTPSGLVNQSAGSNLDHTSGFHQVGISKTQLACGVRNQNGSAPIHRFSEAVCMSKASHYRSLRDHAFRQAGQAYQTSRSVPTRRGGALVYAEEGRKYDLKAKYWELEAGKAKVRERNGMGGVGSGGGGAGMARSIDLHGLSRIQALAVTREFLTRWESSSEKPSASSPLLIITGAGKHSHKSTPVLLPAITRYLTRENWQWRYQHDFVGGSKGAVYVEGVVRS